MRNLILITTLLLALSTSAAASAHCRAPMPMPSDYPSKIAHDDVTIDRYQGMTCARAIQIAAAAYDLPNAHLIYDPTSPGGWYGPFSVAGLKCWLDARGSDFRIADCRGPGQFLKFNDHRDYFVMPIATAICSYPMVAPSTLDFSADGARAIIHIHWRWGLHDAKGTGRAMMNDCRPACSDGHWTSETAHLHAYRPINDVFTRLTITGWRAFLGRSPATTRAVHDPNGWSWSYPMY